MIRNATIDDESLMRGKRKILAGLLNASGAIKLLMASRPLMRERFTILAYHRILPHFTAGAFHRDPELVSATQEVFYEQVKWLKRHFEVISFADLKRCEENHESLPGNALIITFDDGFKDNHKVAFPILQACAAPATFFIATDYIGTSEPFWFDKVYSDLLICNNKEFTISGRSFTLGDDEEGKEAAARAVLRSLIDAENEERLAFLANMKTHGLAQAPLDEMDLPMTWEEVREMSAGGMEIGSHTKTHPILTKVKDQPMAAEIRESKRVIEEKTGKEVTTIAYPVGVRFAYSEKIKQAARDSGYRYGVSYVQGNNSFRTKDDFELRRVHVESYHHHEASFRFDILFPPNWG